MQLMRMIRNIYKHKNFWPILVLILAILVGIAFFNFVLVKSDEKSWIAGTSLTVTGLSIIIGAMISALTYESQQTRKKEEELFSLRKNLSAELSDIKRALSSTEYLKINGINFLVTYVESIVIKECAKRGFFNSVETENLLHISRKIEFYNVQVEYLLSIINSGGENINQVLPNCNQNMITTRDGILEAIELITKKMDLTLSDSIYQA